MKLYVDTSVLLRIAYDEPNSLAQWLTWESAYASAIQRVEARRSLARTRLSMRLDDQGVATLAEALKQFAESIFEVAVTQAILDRASADFGVIVGTLDALHLGTALELRDRVVPDLVFATHDRQQAVAARAMGLDVIGVDT